MRARQPDIEGFVEPDGIAVFYEVFGTGEPTILLLPSWQMVHSRQWKAQVPYLARHFTWITFDARGNGRSDRPTTPEAYGHREIVADAVAVLDAAGVGEAVFAGTSMGGLYALEAAAWHPERVLAVIAIGAVAPFVGPVTPGESRVYDLFGAGGIAAYQRQVGLNGYRTRRAAASGGAGTGRRVGTHGVRGRRTRPARLPGVPANGRDHGRQLHGLPRTGRAGAVRPGSSR